MKHQIIQISLPLQLYIHKLSNQTQFKLNRINEIKYYFIAKIREREAASKVFSKYIATFDNFDIVLSVSSGGVSIDSFATVIGMPIVLKPYLKP